METKYTSLIERYFDRLLSIEETDKVEQLKKTDSDFLEEFELFEKSHQAIKLSTIINLKEEIKGIHKNMDASPARGKVIKLRWMGAAASILLLVCLGFYTQQFSNQNLYDEAYSPVGDYITNMDNDLSEMEQGISFFDKQEFDSASYLFNRIYARTGDQTALFYEGHSHYQAGRMEEAITSLNKVTNNYQPEAQWYVALAYLKIEKSSNSLKTLNTIIKDNRDKAYVLKAKKLKSELSNPFRKFVF